RQQRRAAGQDRQSFGREGGDLVDDPEAFLGAELAAIGEILGPDQGGSAGVELAVLARQVAAVGQIPRDDVGPGEPAGAGHGYMPKKSRAASSIFSSTSSPPCSRAYFSMPSGAMGRTNSGTFARRASAAAVQLRSRVALHTATHH